MCGEGERESAAVADDEDIVFCDKGVCGRKGLVGSDGVCFEVCVTHNPLLFLIHFDKMSDFSVFSSNSTQVSTCHSLTPETSASSSCIWTLRCLQRERESSQLLSDKTSYSQFVT